MTPRTAADFIAEASAIVHTIPAEDAVLLVGSLGTLFIDVREPNERDKSGTVAGAINIPRGLLEFQADSSSPSHRPEVDPAKRVVLFCASGGRSTLAAYTLEQMGFRNVLAVEGGFSALELAGAPIARS